MKRTGLQSGKRDWQSECSTGKTAENARVFGQNAENFRYQAPVWRIIDKRAVKIPRFRVFCLRSRE